MTKIGAKSTVESIPSNRAFGVFFSFIFGLLLVYRYSTHAGIKECLFYLTIICCLLLTAFLKPGLLRPFNVAWFIFGQALAKFISPIIWIIFFYFLITPVAVILRISGRDELQIKNKNTKSYWLNRNSTLYKKESFKNQF